MLNKIIQKIEHTGPNTIIRKTFQRGLQTVNTTSAYIDNKLYFRRWEISEYGKLRRLSQTYNAGHPIKGSRSILDLVI